MLGYAWFDNWPKSVVTTGQKLLKDLRAEGVTKPREQIARFSNLIPEKPSAQYWPATRWELGRLLRLRVSRKPRTRTYGGGAGAGSGSETPRISSSKSIRFDRAMTFPEFVNFMSSRTYSELELMSGSVPRAMNEVDKVNQQRQRAGVEPFASDVPISEIIDLDEFRHHIEKLAMNIVEHRRKKRAA